MQAEITAINLWCTPSLVVWKQTWNMTKNCSVQKWETNVAPGRHPRRKELKQIERWIILRVKLYQHLCVFFFRNLWFSISFASTVYTLNKVKQFNTTTGMSVTQMIRWQVSFIRFFSVLISIILSVTVICTCNKALQLLIRVCF